MSSPARDLLALSLLLLIIALNVASCGPARLTVDEAESRDELVARRDAAEAVGDTQGVAFYEAELDRLYSDAARRALEEHPVWSWVKGVVGPWGGVLGAVGTFFAPVLFDESRQRAKSAFKRLGRAAAAALPWNAKVQVGQAGVELLGSITDLLQMWSGSWGQLSLRKTPPASGSPPTATTPASSLTSGPAAPTTTA